MAEYSIGFAKDLVLAAKNMPLDTDASTDRQRAALYLSLLACEISMKALLEAAGFHVQEIKKLSHNLSALLEKVGACKVKLNGIWVPATRIRAIVADQQFPVETIGKLLEAEKSGASKYPNNVRYGDLIQHFPAEIMLATATKVAEWAEKNIGQINK